MVAQAFAEADFELTPTSPAFSSDIKRIYEKEGF